MSDITKYSTITGNGYRLGEIIGRSFSVYVPGIDNIEDFGPIGDLPPDSDYVVGEFDDRIHYIDLTGVPTAKLRAGPQPTVDKTTALVGENFTFSNCDTGGKFMIQATDNSTSNLFAREEEFDITEDIILFSSPEAGIFDITITSTWPELDYQVQITVTET